MKSIMLAAVIGFALAGALKSAEAGEPATTYKRSVPAPLTAADFKKPIDPTKLQARKNVPAPLTAADFHRSLPKTAPTSTGYQRTVPPPLTADDFHRKGSAAPQDAKK